MPSVWCIPGVIPEELQEAGKRGQHLCAAQGGSIPLPEGGMKLQGDGSRARAQHARLHRDLSPAGWGSG